MTTRPNHITLTPMAETPIGRHIAATHANLTAVVFFVCLAALAALTAHALVDWNHQQEIAARV